MIKYLTGKCKRLDEKRRKGEGKNAPKLRTHHANSIRRVISPFFLPSFTHRPTISSNSPRENVAPDPPANNSTCSYRPRSIDEPPYGPSIMTCNCGSSGCLGRLLNEPSLFSWSPARLLSFASVRTSSSAINVACWFSALVQSPFTLAPNTNPPPPMSSDSLMHDVPGGAARMVRGCDSRIRPEKKTRRRTCWPAIHPSEQNGTRICGE